jgi:hypothetical protein
LLYSVSRSATAKGQRQYDIYLASCNDILQAASPTAYRVQVRTAQEHRAPRPLLLIFILLIIDSLPLFL